MILRDMICRKENPCVEVFVPSRFLAEELPQGKAGVYKTEDDKIFQVDIVCPHMGCELVWNPDEHSWDCPCHGSRFDYEGNLTNGPAQEEIYDE